LKWFVVIQLRNLLSKLVYETLLIVVVPLNVIRNDPFKSEVSTKLLPIIKMAPSWIMSMLLCFSLIFFQIDFLPFSYQVNQVFSIPKIQ